MRVTDGGVPGHAFVQLLDADVLSADAVKRLQRSMARDGVSVESLLRPGSQAPLAWFREAYPDLDAEQAAYLGWIAGEQAQLTSYGLLSLPMISAGSVSEVLRLLTFVPLISSALRARFLPAADGVTITLTAHTGDPTLDRFPIAYCGAAVMRLVELLVDGAPEMSVEIAWPQPTQLQDHPAIASGRVLFGAALHAVKVPAATLDAACRFSDPVGYAHAVKDLQRALTARANTADLAEQVRHALGEHPRLRPAGEIAAQLNLSLSTLKRRLQAAGTSFSDILDAALYDEAMLQLMEPSTPINRIADNLGYSDVANFAHAFKRWSGASPGQFRRLHLGLPHVPATAP